MWIIYVHSNAELEEVGGGGGGGNRRPGIGWAFELRQELLQFQIPHLEVNAYN